MSYLIDHNEVRIIPLGYGTYGLKNEDPFEAIPRLKTMGFDLVELTAATGWPTAPGCLDEEARRRLVGLFQKVALPPPVLLAMPQPFSSEVAPSVIESEWRELCQLARDLHFPPSPAPIVTVTLGNNLPEWTSGREIIAEKVTRLGKIAGEYGVLLALEPHVGCSFDRPEKAAWLVKQIALPQVRLNCDISHFLAQGIDIEMALEEMIPLSVYAHVKEVDLGVEPFRFLLPGAGNYDFSRYFATLGRLGYDGSVVVEVSGQVWTKTEYKPWEAAAFCFKAMDIARHEKHHVGQPD